MNKLEFIDHLETKKFNYQAETGEMDGFDMAFFQGAEHILTQCGDGGISEQYFRGIKYALDNLSEGALYG